MCRSIKTLFNFEPPATDDEVRAASLQFVRKLSGFSKPSQANEDAFAKAGKTSVPLRASCSAPWPPTHPPKIARSRQRRPRSAPRAAIPARDLPDCRYQWRGGRVTGYEAVGPAGKALVGIRGV